MPPCEHFLSGFVWDVGKKIHFRRSISTLKNFCSLLPLWVSRIKRGAPEKRTRGDGVFRASNFSPLSLSVEENGYDEYENELGITAIALYDYQAGKQILIFNLVFKNSVLHR